jgi:hypothetical protein
MQASALPFFTFSFHQESGFLVSDASPITPTGTPGNNIGWYGALAGDPGLVNPPANTWHTLAWGESVVRGPLASDPLGNSNMSALNVVGHSGTVTTGGPIGSGSDWGAWVPISTVIHQNNPIPASSDLLATASIVSNLHFDVGTTVFHTDSDTVNITFRETLNGAPCVDDGNPVGTVCDDRFGFPGIDFTPLVFTYGGHSYQVEFDLQNLHADSGPDPVTDYPACDKIVGQCTVWTGESATSSIDIVRIQPQ